MILSETQHKILDSLLRYRYLSVRQMVHLGIYSSEKKLRERVLSKMKAPPNPIIKAADFGFIAGKGRLPHLYYLTKKGALLLADYHRTGIDSISYPIGSVQFSRDYFHRVEFISLHIALRQYAEAKGLNIEFFDAYFDTQGNQRQRNSQLVRATQVQLNNKTIVPDGNFRLAMQDGKKRLFTLELHKGSDTQKIIQQLENHALIINKDLLREKYHHPFSHYVLSVYDNVDTLKAVQNRFSTSPLLSRRKKHFAFNTSEAVEGDFSQGWQYASGQAFSVFSG